MRKEYVIYCFYVIYMFLARFQINLNKKNEKKIGRIKILFYLCTQFLTL